MKNLTLFTLAAGIFAVLCVACTPPAESSNLPTAPSNSRPSTGSEAVGADEDGKLPEGVNNTPVSSGAPPTATNEAPAGNEATKEGENKPAEGEGKSEGENKPTEGESKPSEGAATTEGH